MDALADRPRILPDESGPGAIDGVRVGIGGWIYAPWRHSFYPPGLSLRRELHYASRRVATIEVNSTFYGAEPPATYARWASEVPEDFVFSVRAPRHVTERGLLARARHAVHGFVAGLSGFGARLGPVVWQLPPSRAFDHGDLGAFLDHLPRELDGRPLRHALDVRHPSFLDPAYAELATGHGIATVCTDAPGLPAMADTGGPFAYYRLARARRELPDGYEAATLDAWAARTRGASGTPARDTFVYFIGGARQRDPAAAMALIARLRATPAG